MCGGAGGRQRGRGAGRPDLHRADLVKRVRSCQSYVPRVQLRHILFQWIGLRTGQITRLLVELSCPALHVHVEEGVNNTTFLVPR